MKRLRIRYLVLAAVVLGALPGVARTARACSLPPCPPPILPLKAGATVPANVPALRFAGLVTTSVVDLELVTDAGTKIETTVETGDFYAQLVPAQPLSSGQAYRLRYREACSAPPIPPSPDAGASDAGAPLREIPFVAGAAATLPRVLGDATLGPVSVVEDPSALIGKIAVGEFVVVPSAELAPFLPVTTFEVRLNGRRFAESATGPGDVEAAGRKLVVRSVCSGALSTCGDYAAPGSYMATVAAVMPGLAQPLESPPFALDLTCGDLDGGRDAPSEATPPIDAPSPPPEKDAATEGGSPGIDAGMGSPLDPGSADASCSCSTRRSAAPPPWWALLPMALVARASRRRVRAV